MDLANLLVSALVGLAGAIVGVLATVFTLRQHRLEAAQFVADWFRDLRTWASSAIDVLSEAAYCCAPSRQHQPDPGRTRECRARLSALVDSGRFLLPNERHDDVGTGKPAAYRGVRHPALDLLVAAEQILGGDLSPERAGMESAKHALIQVKREFVSTTQELLDPREHNREVARLLAIVRQRELEPSSPLGRLLAGQKAPAGD